MPTKVDMQSLRIPLLVGAIVGAVLGVLSSQPLRASAPVADVAATQACRMLCESVTWLRAPVRYRAKAAG